MSRGSGCPRLTVWVRGGSGVTADPSLLGPRRTHQPASPGRPGLWWVGATHYRSDQRSWALCPPDRGRWRVTRLASRLSREPGLGLCDPGAGGADGRRRTPFLSAGAPAHRHSVPRGDTAPSSSRNKTNGRLSRVWPSGNGVLLRKLPGNSWRYITETNLRVSESTSIHFKQTPITHGLIARFRNGDAISGGDRVRSGSDRADGVTHLMGPRPRPSHGGRTIRLASPVFPCGHGSRASSCSESGSLSRVCGGMIGPPCHVPARPDRSMAASSWVSAACPGAPPTPHRRARFRADLRASKTGFLGEGVLYPDKKRWGVTRRN